VIATVLGQLVDEAASIRSEAAARRAIRRQMVDADERRGRILRQVEAAVEVG